MTNHISLKPFSRQPLTPFNTGYSIHTPLTIPFLFQFIQQFIKMYPTACHMFFYRLQMKSLAWTGFLYHVSGCSGKLCCVIHECIPYLKLISVKFCFTTQIWTLKTTVCEKQTWNNKVATVPKCPQVRQTHQPLPISTTMVGWLRRVTHSARRLIWAASLPCDHLGVCVWHFKHPA